MATKERNDAGLLPWVVLPMDENGWFAGSSQSVRKLTKVHGVVLPQKQKTPYTWQPADMEYIHAGRPDQGRQS